tara:strand:- start:385 stop:648 length:264 start_codon:yes stop_codon:yes gene_type:complete
MPNAIKLFYAQARAHQMDTYHKDGLYIDGVDQRQFTGGGAAYGMHAIAAFNSARSKIFFIDNFSADIRNRKKRSAAAKRGWKTRKNA